MLRGLAAWLPLKKSMKRSRSAHSRKTVAFVAACLAASVASQATEATDQATDQATNQCAVLTAATCAETCVPESKGSRTVDFSCGDWWTKANCCNGTNSVPFSTTNVFFDCKCECSSAQHYPRSDFCFLYLFHLGAKSDSFLCFGIAFLCFLTDLLFCFCGRLHTTDKGLTSQGLGVIIAATLAAALAILAAVLYVLYRYGHGTSMHCLPS